MDLLLKICGITSEEQAMEVDRLVSPEFIGLIFYPLSKRFVGKTPFNLPLKAKKTGVFVNEKIENVLQIAKEWNLNAIQLHGEESVPMASELRSNGYTVIKAISMGNDFLSHAEKFDGKVDYLLFDTSTAAYGGSGKKFNWELLNDLSLQTPWFLSGGLQIEDIPAIGRIKLTGFCGVDFNSGLEISPGQKDVMKIIELKKQLGR